MNTYMKRTIKMIPLFSVSVFVFAVCYYILGSIDETSFTINNVTNRKLTVLEAIYFSVVTQSTIGFGDFSPNTVPAKVIVISHILITYILFGLTVLV